MKCKVIIRRNKKCRSKDTQSEINMLLDRFSELRASYNTELLALRHKYSEPISEVLAALNDAVIRDTFGDNVRR